MPAHKRAREPDQLHGNIPAEESEPQQAAAKPQGKGKHNAPTSPVKSKQPLAPGTRKGGVSLQGLPHCDREELLSIFKGNPLLQRSDVHMLMLPQHKKECAGNPAWKAMQSHGVDSCSCHVCQRQHPKLPCKSCDTSICYRCLWRMTAHIAAASPNVIQEFNSGVCPKCLGLCSCRGCMRKAPKTDLDPFPKGQLDQYAHHILASAGPVLRSNLDAEDAVAREAGFADGLRGVPQRRTNGDRVLCDSCATSLPHMHWACPMADDSQAAETGNSTDSSCQDCCIACHREQGSQGTGQVLCKRHQVPLELSCFTDAGSIATFHEALEFMAQHGLGTEGPAGTLPGTWRWGPDTGESGRRGAVDAAGGAAEQALGMEEQGDSGSPHDSGGSSTPFPASLGTQHVAQASAEVGRASGNREGLTLGKDEIPELLQRIGLAHLTGVFAPGIPASLQDIHDRLLALQTKTSSKALEAALRRLQNEDWIVEMPRESTRLAAARPHGLLNRLYTPDAADFALGNPNRNEKVQHFQSQWALGIPVVVRNIRRKFDWTPECMMRATRDVRTRNAGKRRGKTAAATEESEEEAGRICVNLEVIHCDSWTLETMSQEAFFGHYRTWDHDHPCSNLKLKDFPPEGLFRDSLQRHHQDFLEMLPIPEVTHPKGPLNMHGFFPDIEIKPDLGPKSYIALGNSQEVCGRDSNSVTKLHVDLSDAINVTLHVRRCAEEPPPHVRCGSEVADTSKDPTYGGAGAVWQIFARTDVPLLQQWMQEHANEFLHGDQHPAGFDLEEPICHQKFMLGSTHLESLKQEKGVEPWTFEQHDGEGVFIPAGCPHQVRNLRPATKVALDFVAPESASVAQRLREVLP
ncbi:hypothetical protein WJX84_006777 [Apatococcus fuscideae]|uniref:JmjC domain-containing protein n=1 Tax=Apatococcus fuscideae TaxID=2026836 RepID=A0AAW1T8M8_9CHLO